MDDVHICSASGAGCSFVETGRGVMCAYCGVPAGESFMLCDELEVTPLIRDGETIEKTEPVITVEGQRSRPGRKVAYIPHRPSSGRLLATMLGSMMVAGFAEANIFREEPIRNTTGGPVPESYEDRLRREADEQRPRIDRAEAKRQRKAEKRRLRGRL